MARTPAARLGHRTGRWIVWVVTLCAVGAVVTLIALIVRPKDNPVTESNTLNELPHNLAPFESRQLVPLSPQPNSLLSTQPNNKADELTDSSTIDPLKTQAEQGLDDGSGMTYPCIPVTDSVCQRPLSEAEAKARGY